ncbi:kinesin-like protein KIN-14U isoform X1 [Nymphaea colorata]|nr:kinesin-like protein KIN-14U isoform X1 [Nymphaea colorata]XP_031496784.1 kinesin-like protein KIN-14U isoform X1 [Nymphaea colorata]XP_031496785.1 kinesin-like protein KIN-14U isoform X1 [Nymphaea colorata]XP_049935859.1 kinesin-like protein KIN-14U isoform X1 [Nymphaea colorata]
MDESSGCVIGSTEALGEPAEMLDRPQSLDTLPAEAVFTNVALVPEYERKELEETISKLEGEAEDLRSQLRHLDAKRRDALSRLLDLKGSIRVFCRIRPFLQAEKRSKPALISPRSEKIWVQGIKKKEFVFDRVFSHQASQEDVFVEVEPILKSALDGHNVCIFAYGQTGTGKTFTMEGTSDCPGIVPRAIKTLLHQASIDKAAAFKFSLSMVEVYMGNLKDLLGHKPSTRMVDSSCFSRSSLNMQTDAHGAVEIDGLTELTVTDFAQANKNYVMGRKARSTCWTNANEASSRSHCLTRLTIIRHEGKKAISSKLWMVDLGGSERLLKTKATGQTLDEGRAINLSLSALGDVICALRRKRNHVPYRNSKLTQVLKDSLGLDSKALMVIHISPKEDDINETICSMNFGQRARSIECHKECPEELKILRQKKIAELDQEMRSAEKDCQVTRDHIQSIESKLEEKKRILSLSNANEDQTGSPTCPLSVPRELFESPKASAKSVTRNSSVSVPRFMLSTACSRQRQLAENEAKVAKANRSGRKYVSDVDFQLSGSRILFQSNSIIKASPSHGLSPRTNAKKLHIEELSSMHPDTPVHDNSGSKFSKTPQNNRLSASPLVSNRRNLSDPMFRKRLSDRSNSCDMTSHPSKGTKLIRCSMPNTLKLIHDSDYYSSVNCHS